MIVSELQQEKNWDCVMICIQKIISTIFIHFSELDLCRTQPPDNTCSFGESNMVRRWYYSANDEKCIEFLYDIECGNGDGNIFLTKQKCESKCMRYRPI